MKLNIINVLNEIANEEATVIMLNDPDAFWNMDSIQDLFNAYEYYKCGVEMENESTIDLIEHCIKYGWECPNIKCEKVLSFDEWEISHNNMMAKYLVY